MKTDSTFNPKNPYQTQRTRVLFCCTAGLLRAPTFSNIGMCNFDLNTRSCGSDKELALIPISTNLVLWADKIYFMLPENLEQALYQFKTYDFSNQNIKNLIEEKSSILGIPDIFEYMQPELQQTAKEILQNEGYSSK